MRTRSSAATLLVAALLAVPTAAQQVNTAQLSENGWFSDDTRADGTVDAPPGQNLISPTLTDAPEGASLSANAADDDDILNQILFGAAPGTPPAGTWKGAVRMRIEPFVVPGKSQISHRKDDPTGHGSGAAFGPGFTAEYSWIGFGTPTTTASLKFGFRTADFGSTGSSSRTGENTWDKVLIYEPGQGNGKTSDGSWHTETIDWSNGKFWFFDRTVIASSQSMPRTLEELSTDTTPFSGSKTLKDVYDLITAPTTVLTSVQFGIGSNNPGADVYVNQLETSAYRPGQVTTFGTPSPFDQNVTPEVIFGSGNTNGAFTVARSGALELGLRSKQRFPAANTFNSNGDGSYSWNTGDASGNGDGEWNFEWTVNTDVDGSSGLTVGDYTYEIGIDYDPSGDTDFNAFDPITSTALVPIWDHAFGTNATGNGGGTTFTSSQAAYQGALDTFNVAQQSWRHTFFDVPPFTFDPTLPGRYDVYLAAFLGGAEVARTEIAIFASNGTTLSLEADVCQQDFDAGLPGVQVAYTLNLRNPDDLDVSGFQSFLTYDTGALTYEGSASTYDDTFFDAHIRTTATAEVAPGMLQLDGNAFGGNAADGDALLATLVFTVGECDLNAIQFDLTGPFASEVSFGGSPLATALIDSPDVLGDDTAPVFGPNPNVTQAADAGSCTEAVVNYTLPTVTDNCDPAPALICNPPSGSTFPVGTTTVTCTATDECGNVAVSTFDVTVTATNLIDVTVDLIGSDAASRCILFVPDDCGASVSETLSFASFTGFARATATIEVPCGVYTQLCAKDEQHTLWDTVGLTVSGDGSRYELQAFLALEPGDTDNDGDVDINDVTLFLGQFGDPALSGGCAWNGTRDADFTNNGFVQSTDYSALVANWLQTSDCACTAPASGEGVRERVQRVIPVRDAASRAADLNGDRMVDWRDVRLFEDREGLPHALSERMRSTR